MTPNHRLLRNATTDLKIVVGIGAAAVLCVITPAALISEWTQTNVLLGLNMVLAGLRLSILMTWGQPRLMAVAAWTFVYVFMGIAPLAQTTSMNFPETTPALNFSFAETASWVAVLGSIFLFVGECLFRPTTTSATGGWVDRAVDARRAKRVAIVALTLNAYYVAAIGPTSLFLSRNEIRAVQYSTWSNEAVATLTVATCTFPLLVAHIALRRLPPNHAAPTLSLLTLVALLASVNPINSPRYYFGTVLLALLADRGAFRTVGRMRLSTGTYVGAFVFLYPIADVFRRSTSVAVDFSPTRSLRGGDFDSFAQIINTVEYTREMGYTWGYQALGAATFWVPRSAWPSKPISTGTLLAEYKQYEFTRISSSLWSELFINAGWPALGLGMLAAGYAISSLDHRLIRSIKHGGYGFARPILIIVPAYLPILLRGSLIQAMLILVVLIVAERSVTVPKVYDFEPIFGATDTSTTN